MSDNNTFQMRSSDKNGDVKTSGEYTVYDGPTVAGHQAVKGFAFLTSAAQKAGQYIEIELSEGDDLQLEKTTSATGRYSTESAAVRHIYISHQTLEEFGGDGSGEEFVAPESLGISISASDEEAYEESKQTPEDAEEEADGLLSGLGGSEDEVEVEEETDEEAEADALLGEVEDAA